MTVASTKPWTIDQFLDWAARQDPPYEFDGHQPVAMTGGTVRHNRIAGNLHAALRTRLRGTRCAAYGPDLAVQTAGNALRYPDALVTCVDQAETSRIATDVLVAFEVVSPTSGRTDRITKVAEYAAVRTLRRYAIIESEAPGLLVFHRVETDHPWTAQPLTLEDTVAVPELPIEIPVAELYDGVRFTD